MNLRNNEFQINKKGTPYESIEISKSVLEEWREHYTNVANKYEEGSFMRGFYIGKRDTIVDILKHFEDLEG